MRRLTVCAALGCALLCLWAAPPAAAQEMAANGNFELQAPSPWQLYGSNVGTSLVQFDVDGAGGPSWCVEREPGSNLGSGGIKQNVLLIANRVYQFQADVAYYSC